MCIKKSHHSYRNKKKTSSVQKRAGATISAHNIPNDVLFDNVESRLCIKVNARFAPGCTGCFRALDGEDNEHHISDRPVFIKEAGEGDVVVVRKHFEKFLVLEEGGGIFYGRLSSR